MKILTDEGGLRKRIIELIHEIPTRTVPRLRRLLSADEHLGPIISRISDRTIYPFLEENGLSQNQRYRLLRENGRKSFKADCPYSA